MAGNGIGTRLDDPCRDLADYDRLPATVRQIIREAPEKLYCPSIFARWRLHEFDGGDERGFARKLKRKIRGAVARPTPALNREEADRG